MAKVAIALALIGWCVLAARRFDRYFPLTLPGLVRPLGFALMLAGAVLVLYCGAILSTRGILSRGDRLFPAEFVAFGPFRYARNPMSLGGVTLFLGLALVTQSVSVLLVTLLIFVVMHLNVVYVEEPGLEKRFGNSYRDYKRAVNRWLPSYGAINRR